MFLPGCYAKGWGTGLGGVHFGEPLAHTTLMQIALTLFDRFHGLGDGI
jgi:hypothetical protein